MQSIESKEQLDQILQSPTPPLVVLDIYADWCGPCRTLSPRLEQLASDTPGAKFLKINIEKLPLPNIDGLPTIQFWVVQPPMEPTQPPTRRLVKSIVGADWDAIQTTVQNFLSPDPRVPQTKRPHASRGSQYATYKQLMS